MQLLALRRKNFVYSRTKNSHFSMCPFRGCSFTYGKKNIISPCIRFELLWDCGDIGLNTREIILSAFGWTTDNFQALLKGIFSWVCFYPMLANIGPGPFVTDAFIIITYLFFFFLILQWTLPKQIFNPPCWGYQWKISGEKSKSLRNSRRVCLNLKKKFGKFLKLYRETSTGNTGS